MTLRPRFFDLVKSLLCLGGGLLWVAVAVRYVPDTSAGAAVLLTPFFVVLAVGAYFMGRSRGLFGAGNG
jgi:hypothetical protein